jgi:hypothetical protein
MSEREILDEITEIAFDPGLKATAIRDQIREVLEGSGYLEEEDEDESEDDGEG